MPTFSAELIGNGPKSAWTFLRIPAAVSKAFAVRARLPVRGTINGFAFRSSVFPDGKGGHHMMINKAMRDGAKADQGDTVKVVMERDDAPREVQLPPELKRALAKNAAAKKRFADLSPSCKKEYADYIATARREETRTARVHKAVEMIAAGRKRLK
jgi:hypothetical protein